MKGLVVLVTGSTDGIGRQTAIDLAKRGAHVVIHGRNQHRAEAAFEEVVAGSGSSDLAMVSGDLASPDGTRSISDAVHARYDRIDVLINNAGVYKTDRQLSHDGFELTFAVNHLSYFLLTGLLLDLVRRSSHARIINVASQAHASRIDFENLQGERRGRGAGRVPYLRLPGGLPRCGRCHRPLFLQFQGGATGRHRRRQGGAG